MIDEVGAGAVVERRDDGWVVLSLGVSSDTAMRAWVLGLLDHVEVIGPSPWRRSVVEWLQSFVDGHGAPVRSESLSESGPAVADKGANAPAGRVGGRTARQRLRRLLAVVGWLAQVGEAPLAEVAERFEISPDELVAELELAACCGRPPYTPDTLLEIVVTDTMVQAFLPAELGRPRRLTPSEGFALAASARTILAVPGADGDGALARALGKLEAALGARPVAVDLDEPRYLSAVRDAVDQKQAVDIVYHSGSTDETTTRRIDPLALVSLDGHWYVDAYCHRAHDLRRFRIDRIRSFDPVGPRRGEPPPPAPATDAFVPGPGARSVRLSLDRWALWIADSVPLLDASPGRDGGVEVTLAVGGLAWLERLLLQAGPHARVLAPAELRDVGVQAAERVLRRYGGAEAAAASGAETTTAAPG